MVLLCFLMSLAGIPAYTLPPSKDFVTPDFAATVDLLPTLTWGATPTCPAKVQKSPISALTATANAAVSKQPQPILTLCAI